MPRGGHSRTTRHGVEVQPGVRQHMGSGFLAIEADWTLFLLLAVAWYILLKHWENSGKLDEWNASRVLFGLVLMLRTPKGKNVLEKISKPRRFWRAYGEVSLWVCWLVMFFVAISLIAVIITTFIVGLDPNPPPVSELVAIPGISPIFPLGWGILALVICLVIHEFGHGIQARAHGMRVRNFGLLMIGPFPAGAFAEPEYSEIINSPRRERQRMFAAGPATNLFAAFFLMILLGQVAGQFTAADPGVHSSQIIIDSAADEAGLHAWDRIIAINDTEIIDGEDFNEVMSDISAGQNVSMEIIRYESGSKETLMVNMTDKHAYFLDSGYDNETLALLGIERGDAFLGCHDLAGGTGGVDRLAGWAHPDFESNPVGYLIQFGRTTGTILFTPFEYQGVAIHPAQEEMLDAGDGWLTSLLGLGGLLFLVNLMFWLIWVNILLGFTNLFPIVPFDGGHLFRDVVHGTMSGIRNIGKKTGLYKLHPLWVEHVTRKASSISSLILLLGLGVIIVGPYILQFIG